MLISEIPVIAANRVTPPYKRGREVIKTINRLVLLTGCVYIIIVSTKNKPLSTTTKLLINDTWVCV